MRTLTKVLIGMGAGAIAIGSYAIGFAVGDDDGYAGPRMSQEARPLMGDMPMGGMDPAAMQAIHDAMDPATMDAMHEEMVDQLPPALRDDADAMHEQMMEMHDVMGGVDR